MNVGLGPVLVVRAGALGDTLMVTPVIRRLHQTWPGRGIDLLCSVSGAAVLRSNPRVSRAYALRWRNLPRWFSPEKRRLIAQIRERNYDFAIVLESAQSYRELLDQAGLRDIRGFTETPFDPARHAIVNNLRAAGFEDSTGADLDMDLPVPPEAAAWASQTMAALPRPWIGIHAGYGPAGKKKGQTDRLRGWAAGNFIQVTRELIGRGASIVLTGSDGDIDTSQEIARALPVDRVLMCAGRTSVDQLIGVIKSLDLLVSVDSGPAHIAAALGTPLVVLWGPGIFDQTRPVSSTTPIRILNAGVPCAPCYGTPLMKQCVRNICMEQILPAEVVSASLGLLGSLMPPGSTLPVVADTSGLPGLRG